MKNQVEIVNVGDEDEAFEGEFDVLTPGEVHAGGGHRSDEDHNVYWLDLHQLAEYERADLRIRGDEEFWKWFAEFRKTKDVKKKRGRVWEERTTGSGSTFWGSTKDYVSKWWKDWGWEKGAKTTTGDELAHRLALALQAVATTVKVINETGKPWTVRLASKDVREAPTSYTDFEARQVVISPQALLDTTIEAEKGIRITTGYGCHEGSHIQESEEVWGVLRNPSVLEPLLVSSTGLNILEDDRIESITSEKFPGFAQFFDEMLSYLWDVGKDHHPTKWEDTELPEKLNVVIASTRWPDDFKPFVDASTDPKLKDMYDWCQEWRENYLNGVVGPRESIERLLAKLNADPETQQQCEQQTKDERKQGSGNAQTMTDEEFEQFLKQLKDGKGLLEPCPSPNGNGQKITLSEEQAQRVQDLIDEQLQVTQTKLTFPDAYAGVTPYYVVTKPKETEDSRAWFSKPKPSLVERMRNAFFFRRPKMAYAERMLRSGQVDEDGLWRVGDGDFRVFERQIQDPERSTAVTMLIDSSGSMSGRKLMLAQELAIVMLECLKTMTGVRAMVRAHTSGETEVNGQRVNATNIYRIWEPGDPIQRLGLLNSDEISHNANWDGFSIQYCLEEMVRNARPDEQQVLIVISDGLPNGDGLYSGAPAMKHMRRVVDHFEAQTGAVTIQIAVDPHGLNPQAQATMFRYWIPFESQEKLPVQLTNLLIKLFGGHA